MLALTIAGIAFLYSIWHSPTVRSRLVRSRTPFTSMIVPLANEA